MFLSQSVLSERERESIERASSRASFSFALFFSLARESREVCVSYSAIEGVKREREREGWGQVSTMMLKSTCNILSECGRPSRM